MPKYTDEDIRNMSKITCKIAADYLGISPMAVSIGMRNDLLPIGFAIHNEERDRTWQIHVFGEGNTRTTAVFFIKYLRTLGFDVTNDIFAENAWYFRNALVRANYNDLKNGVHETTEYLELFLRNLLLDEKNELHNRTMHISGRFAEVDIERVKVDIESGEVDIESTKVDIRNKLLSFSDTISEKTINHTVEIFSKCGKENCFGRTIVEEITGLKPSGASKLIKLLVDSEVIVPVTGHGKGKYRFQ